MPGINRDDKILNKIREQINCKNEENKKIKIRLM